MAKPQTWQSIAGHHPECPVSEITDEACQCEALYKRDSIEKESEIQIPFYPESGWPYDDGD